MAYFKLSLLTPRFENNSTIFIEDLITEFFPQRDEYASKKNNETVLQENEDKDLYEYKDRILLAGQDLTIRKNTTTNTYNEKLSKSQNGQKTLTFDLDRYIAKMDEWYENPFANNIINGSQILLTDQYKNEYIFTVTSIKYNIKENNITYNVTCQDSFSYQMARQQDGYTIDNDAESKDFIGAKTVDWWVKKKIIPECYLSSYKYIACDEGLYESLNGEYKTFKYFETLRDVKRIIKEAHIPPVYKNGQVEKGKENDIEFFETIPFSCSGSNVDAALIALGDEVNMQLNTFEHARMSFNSATNIVNRTKYFDKYFWFEPKKNTNRVGLKYSPTRNIQSLAVTHQGQSLTTVLNVDGPTYNDELITLIPTIPPFFHEYFHTQEWADSRYTPGLFSNLCQNQQYTSAKETATVSNKYININAEEDIVLNPYPAENPIAWEITIPISNHVVDGVKLFKRKELFNYFNFFDNNDENPQTSGLVVNYDIISSLDHKVFFTTPNTDIWQLCYKKLNEKTHEEEEFVCRQDIDPIDPKVIDAEFYIKIITMLGETEYTEIGNTNFSEEKVYLNFYRDVTEEDLDFARIADECPWLENKLIDFSYFKKIKDEYSTLLDILQNDLRIVNGQLMFYAQSYYEALRKRTEILAILTNNLDSLGAACQAAIVTPLAETGTTKDISYFVSAYNNVFTQPPQDNNLMGYNDILNDYFYKYYNAQQRFLKNIYNFKKYFNDINLLNKKDLYRYTLTIPKPENLQSVFYSFKKGHFVSIKNNYIYYAGYGEENDDTSLSDYGRPLLPIFSGTNNALTPMKVASKDMWEQQLYKAPYLFGNNFYCDPEKERSSYNNKIEYIKPVFLVKLINVSETEKYRIDETGSVYGYAFVNEKTKINATTEKEFISNNQYVSYIYNSTSMPDPLPWIGTYKLTYRLDSNTSKTIYCKAVGIIEDNDIHYLKLQPITYIENFIKDFGGFNSQNLHDKRVIDSTFNITVKAVYAKWSDDDQLRKSTHERSSYIDIWSVHPVEVCFTGEEANLTEIINNYLLTAPIEDLKGLFTKETPLYTRFNSNVIEKQVINSLLNYINPYYIVRNYEYNEGSGEDFLKKGIEEKKEIAKKQYFSYFPITELYQRAPKFKIIKDQDEESAETNAKYRIERLNLKGQTFEDYINYKNKLMQNANVYQKQVINPYSNDQLTYQRVAYVTPNNQADFLRRVRISGLDLGFMAGMSTIATVSCLFGPVGAIVGLAASAATFLATTLTNPIEGPGVLSDTNIYDDPIDQSFSTYLEWDTKRKKIKEPVYVKTKEGYNLYNEYFNSLTKYTADLNRDYGRERKVPKNVFLDWGRYAAITSAEYKPEEDPNTIEYKADVSTINNIFRRQLFAYTYEGLTNRLYYLDTYYQPLKIDDKITHGNIYGILKLCIGDYQTSWKEETDFRHTLLKLGSQPDWSALETNIFSKELSTTSWYPITSKIEQLDISKVKENNLSVKELLNKAGIEVKESSAETTEHIFKVTINGVPCNIVVYRYRDFDKKLLVDNLRYNDAIENYGATKFLSENLEYFDFTTVNTLTTGYYMLPDISKDRIPANSPAEIGGDQNGFSMDSIYYDSEGKRLYTIQQLLDSNKTYYYFEGLPLEEEDFSDQKREFNVEIYKNEPIWENNCLKTIKQEKLDGLTKIVFPDNYTMGDEFKVEVQDMTLSVKLNWGFLEEIRGLTNGTFWNRYKDRMNLPILFEEAASIEAQLTLYWEQAYTASKYCEYFLPETWTQIYNQGSNNFFDRIITFDEEKNAMLSDTFIPDVKIFKNEKKESILTKYKFTRVDSLGYTKDKIDEMDFISASTLMNNFAIRDIFAQLNEDPYDWYAEEIGETTYYYSNTGGMKWPELFNRYLLQGNSYKEMSGWYVMAYKILKDFYLNLDCSQYNKLTDEHNAIWNKIHENYGFLVLENSYKNDNATTSSDLLKVAKLYFKDKMNPERGYNISIIDTASLENYDGVEIRIGDGIQVDASQYYNEYDQLYKSLSQYLFITDLSYTLRDASNISLTVNSIKYEEGIIKRIAKLIK